MKKKLLLLLLLVATTLCLKAQIPSNGLVAWYPFNGNTFDESTHGYDGSNNGATLTTDRFGNSNKAYYFNGSNAYVVINNQIYLTSYSISAWVKDEILTDRGRIFSNGYAGNYFTGAVDLVLDGYTGSPVPNRICIVNQSGINQSSYYSNIGVDNSWSHIVVTFDTTTHIQKAFLNNIEVTGYFATGFGYSPTPLIPNQNPLFSYRIGCNGGGTEMDYFKGSIDDIYVYNRALSSQEITQIYQDGVSAPISVNQNGCFGNSIPNLTATGLNIRWYSDSNLTTMVNQGNTFNTGQTAAGIYTYYVTQTIANIQGPATTVSLTIHSSPPMPTITQNGLALMSSSTIGNQWYFNGSIIPGATSQFYTVVASGFYQVMVTDSYGCSSISTTLNVNVGIVENAAEIGISIYPNPASSSITIESINSNENAIAMFYNMQGQLLLSQSLQQLKSEIDISGFSQGMYFIKVKSDKGVAMKKFIKE